jgi:hypothetical protein
LEALSCRTPAPNAGQHVGGFVIDIGYGGASVSPWHEGEPRRSGWLGIRRGDNPPVEIATWRCDRCGFLESYAL